jgi:glycosyltransferase involved in cell wall biosynthesis
MILINERGFPPDIRVAKEAKSLSQGGHKVFILCRANSINDEGEEFLDDLGATVVRMHVDDSNFFTKLCYALLLFNIPWENIINIFIDRFKLEALHVHDLFAVPVVLRTKKHGLHLIADLHENMPAAMRSYRSSDMLFMRFLKSLVWNYHWMRYRESVCLKKFDRIVTVVPEASERIVNYGINKNKIFEISNTEDESTFNFELDSVDSGIMSRYKNNWVVSYIGGIGPHRGMDTTLKAVSVVGNKIPGFKCIVVGANNERIRRDLEKLCSSLKVSEFVEIIGWVPFNKVNSYVMASNVCLVPHNNFEHTHTTVPHKLFQYMICKRSVLVSDCAPLKRIVLDSGCGKIFRANDYLDMADKLIWMYEHPDELKKMGYLGHKFALGKYSWRHDSQTLNLMYKELTYKNEIP